MMSEVFCRYGLPEELRFDRGLEFAGAIRDMCVKFDIKRSVISVQHPQANGQVERYV